MHLKFNCVLVPFFIVFYVSLLMASSETQNSIVEAKKTKIDSPEYLPGDIIYTIFTLLPIKNAIVAASTGSPRCKGSWRHNRRFLFGRDFHLQYGQQNLVAIVDHLFNSHEGNEIKTFMLHIDPVGIKALLNKWLQICTQKDLEDLELHFFLPSFTIESSVFNALHKLKTLKLIKCKIQLPEVLSGLQFLHTLSLCKIPITEGMFHALIEHCKMLESIDLIKCSTVKKLNLIARENRHFKKLRIASCGDLKEIEIDSPTLHSIFYHGKFSTIRIVQGMQLYEAFFYFTPSKKYIQPSMVEALVKDLSHVSILTITPVIIEVYV
jgi:hypothetical protein